MRLARVHLSNIACFEDLTLDFRDPKTDRLCPWIVILGENGTGKSTILHMIGATLLQSPAVYRVAADIAWDRYVRGRFSLSPADNADVQVEIVYDTPSFDTGDHYVPVTSRAKLLLTRTPSRQLMGCRFQSAARRNDSVHYSGQSICLWIWPGAPRGTLRRRRDSDNRRRRSGVSLRVALRRWDAANQYSGMALGSLFRTIHPRHTERDLLQYRTAVAALERTLPGIKILEVTPDRDVIVRERGIDVSIDSLSEGYRSAMAWVGDLARRLCDAFPKSADPLREAGVVLVDEIDLHLHPEWQRTVVPRTRRVFPNLQFIVTSHSPFVAQDVRPQDRLIVMRRKGLSGVQVAVSPGFARGWRVDQILTSYLFSLPGTRDESILRAEQSYRRLAEIEQARPLTESENARQALLRRQLDRSRSSPSELPGVAANGAAVSDLSTDDVLSALMDSAFPDDDLDEWEAEA